MRMDLSVFFGFWYQRIMLDPFHTVCEKDTEGNARRNYIVWYMRDKYKSDGVKRVYLFQLMGLSVLSTGVQLLAEARF